jgi:hypothetical protein
MKSTLVSIPSMIIGMIAGMLLLISCGGSVNHASAAAPVDQLICVVIGTWPIDASAYPCTQASNPGTPRTLTIAQVLQEGWTAVSAGGGDYTNRLIMIFYK